MNAWLGGFTAILKQITASNFIWMIYDHTQVVLDIQNQKKEKTEKKNGGDDENEDEKRVKKMGKKNMSLNCNIVYNVMFDTLSCILKL